MHSRLVLAITLIAMVAGTLVLTACSNRATDPLPFTHTPPADELNPTAAMRRTYDARSTHEAVLAEVQNTRDAFVQRALVGTAEASNPQVLAIARDFSGDNIAWQERYPDGLVHTFYDGIEMVLVPAGCFMMGSNEGEEDERPVHQQCFDTPFWLDQTEVTQADFERLGGYGITQGDRTTHKGGQRPVDGVTWFSAHEFCALRGARLPTEAEWEYAARGPSGWTYPWGSTWNEANAVWNRRVVPIHEQGTANVGSFPADRSWVGALDMSGNVSEWVNSWYLPYDDPSDREADATGHGRGLQRVLRSSPWFSPFPELLRGAYRFRNCPNWCSSGDGFRCARST